MPPGHIHAGVTKCVIMPGRQNLRVLQEAQWVDHKNMPAHKVGRLWKFKRQEVDEWVRRGSAAEKAGKASADDESNQS